MISSVKPTDPILYWIAHDEKLLIIHYGIIGKGLQVNTGQKYLETYKDELEWMLNLSALGIKIDEKVFLDSCEADKQFVSNVAKTING